MAETRVEVKTFKVDYVCDTCGEGHMKSNGVCLTSYPPQYQHVCDKCFATQTFEHTYPRMEHEEVT